MAGSDKIPLLKVKVMNTENIFTYPQSMCFFGADSLLIQVNVQKFIANKRYNLKAKMDDVITLIYETPEEFPYTAVFFSTISFFKETICSSFLVFKTVINSVSKIRGSFRILFSTTSLI